MRVLLGVVVIYLLGLGLMFVERGEAAETRLLSFKEWKLGKMQMSYMKIQELRKKQADLRARQPRSEMLYVIQQELNQEQWNYEIAHDFSTQDYLVLYVKQQPGRDKLKKVASQLSQEEVSQFLEAYFNTLQKPAPLPNYQRARLGVSGVQPQ